jgi:hypothetical protein
VTIVRSSCDTCNAPIIRRADGKVLNAEPHRLGINRADGGQLAPSQIAKAFHGTGPLLGHIAHICDPVEQEALFDMVMPARPAKKRRASR